MTDRERLEELINNDQEYQQLVAEVNAFSSGSKGSKFPTDGATLESIWKNVPKFERLDDKEFFATFKCMTAWAVMMSQILNKIHGVGKYDTKKAFNIYGSTGTKQGLIYYEDNPSFYIDNTDQAAPLYITVPLKVFGGNGGLQNGEIMFRLIGPSVIYDPRTMQHTPKLLSSVMEIVINHNGDVYNQPVQVRNFAPTWLAIAINNSRMGN